MLEFVSVGRLPSLARHAQQSDAATGIVEHQVERHFEETRGLAAMRRER
jgi:hypothetical protein